MDTPQNPESTDDPTPSPDPFSELPTDPSFEGILDEIADEPAPSAADELVETTITAVDPSPAKSAPKPRRLFLAALVLCALAVALAGGWIGWSYWVDRQALDALEADLLSARDSAEASKDQTEDAGERLAGLAIAARIEVIVEAPWWDHLAIRLFEKPRIEGTQSQADELILAANHRALNRAWWSQQLAAVDQAIGDADRTIPAVQAARDGLQTADPPKAGAGGFTADGLRTLDERLSADLAQLLEGQNEQLALRQRQLDAIQAAATIDELAASAAAIEQAGPLDRNPPEIAEAKASMRAQAVVVGDFLTARDAMASELTATLADINDLDLNSASVEAVRSIEKRLVELETPNDPRFDEVRLLVERAGAASATQRAILEARDLALRWFDAQRATLESITTVEALKLFSEELLAQSPPPSDLPVVTTRAEDFLARLSARTIMLAEERRLADESRARAELFSAAITAVDAALEAGSLAQGAQLLVNALPETPDQVESFSRVKAGFASACSARLTALATDARSTGSWRELAETLRSALSSDAVRALAPNFARDSADVWQLASLEEDRLIYEDLQRLVSGPYDSYLTTARVYLDDSRRRGEASVMKLAVAAALEALEAPGVTVQIEGVEWSDPQCEWNQARTSLTVALNDVPFGFDLTRVTSGEVTLLGSEVPLQSKHDARIEFGVSGYFDCADDDGVFAGSGGLTMDALRCGGRFALPFWNDGDQSLAPHQLLLIAIPDDEIRIAQALPAWVDPRSTVTTAPAN